MPRRSKQQYFRRLRLRYKRCWYCKVEMVYYPLKKGEKVPDNYATIEHLNSKLQYPNGRPDPRFKARTLVVACKKCNEDRAAKEQSALPIEELWRRSGRPPQHLRPNFALAPSHAGRAHFRGLPPPATELREASL